MQLRSAVLIAAFAYSAGMARAGDSPGVQFNRDIRPILAENCFACHGPDAGARKAKLRLDRVEDATLPHHSGTPVVPGHPESSEVFARIGSTDPEEAMPPRKTGKRLSVQQIQTLNVWIAQGAAWQKHWSLIPPVRSEVPAARDIAWCRNEIDRFVLARLESRGLRPTPAADRTTLIRRLSLDLTGTPPSPADVDAFVADSSRDAYGKLVDRLLASPHYGERLAMQWLDAARYADTNGYNNDGDRTMWRWRDWVIDAFNSNLPYDQFLTDQLAGDLLPGATLDQKIASGFNRNHHVTTEGGAVDEEYRVEYVNDRVQTTSATFLGLTLRCARCHDHKYDPITQKDYYSFFAFFNNVPEQGVPPYQSSDTVVAPYISAPTQAQQAELDRLAGRQREIAGLMQSEVARADASVAAWERGHSADHSAPISSGLLMRLKLDETTGALAQDMVHADRPGTVHGKPLWTAGRFGNAFDFDGQTFIELQPAFSFDRAIPFSVSVWLKPRLGQAMAVLSKMDDADANRGLDIVLQPGGRIESHLIHHFPDNALKVITKQPVTDNVWHALTVTYDGTSKAAGLKVYVDGVAQPVDVAFDVLRDTLHTDKPLHIGKRSDSLPFRGLLDDVRFYDSALDTADVARLSRGEDALGSAALFAIPSDKRTPAQREQLRRLYLTTANDKYARLSAESAEITSRIGQLTSAVPKTMVMQEMPTPRQAHVLRRGEYDKPGEAVSPAVPACFAALPAGVAPNRLALARWMTDPANPLVARVAVNRLWQLAFGNGLVETAEDFGTQGEPPVYPELLDWLATAFVNSGWDTKSMLRLMVMSNTYLQTSQVSEEMLARDPRNRLLARASRFRLPAEMIRDNALAASGLLVDTIGGPSVYPYQPPGLWEEVSVEHRAHYPQGHAEQLYRRSLYCFWKRTSPPPALTTFDAADRETCAVRRARTNTPLQALVLMNDPTYLEASRKLAERIMTTGGATPETRLQCAYELALARAPRDEERSILIELFDSALRRFGAQPQEARKLLAVGESPRRADLSEPELAAWTTVASAILGLDETISRE